MRSIRIRRILLAILVSLSMALVSTGPVEGADSTSARLVTPRQTIELAGAGTAWFEASGEGRLRAGSGPFHGQAFLRTEVASNVFRFRSARIIEDAGGTPVGLELTGRGQVTRDRRPAEFVFTATVQRSSIQDCLIYDFVGPNVSFHFEAEGRLVFSD